MSAAQNPWNQLLSAKRKRNKGDLAGLQKRLWYCLNAAMAGLDDAMAADDGEEVRKWITSITQLSHSYVKCTIEGDVEARLKALEDTMAQSKQGDMSGTYSPARKR